MCPLEIAVNDTEACAWGTNSLKRFLLKITANVVLDQYSKFKFNKRYFSVLYHLVQSR